MRRERERQLEVLVELQSLCEPVDFEEAAYCVHAARCARKRLEYREMRLFDPWQYQLMMARNKAAREAKPRWRPKRKVSSRDAKEMQAMYRAGASVEMIAKAFHVSTSCAHSHVRGVFGTRKPGDRVHVARGPSHPRSKLTPEIVQHILAATGSNRAIARELGLTHQLVGEVRLGRSWVQRPFAKE